WAGKIASEGDAKKMWMPNVIGGQAIGFLCRFIPAIIVLLGISAAGEATGGFEVPVWLTTGLTAFGNMMAALGMGIILSFLIKRKVHWAIFMGGFVLATYFGLSSMAIAVVAIVVAVIVYSVIV